VNGPQPPPGGISIRAYAVTRDGTRIPLPPAAPHLCSVGVEGCGCEGPTRYRVALGHERTEVSAEEARAVWDAWPEGQRTGKRDGAFILWSEDELGRKTLPTIYRPVRPGPSYL
jgi:hypothetical protein